MKLSFDEENAKIIHELNNTKIAVLATSDNNKVSARSMSIVNIGEKVFFQTDKRMEKYAQIQYNCLVALCIGNIQIEGNASILGKANQNNEFIELFKEKHEGSYNKYSNLETEVVIEVIPIRIKIWFYVDSTPYIKEINYQNKTANQNEFVG